MGFFQKGELEKIGELIIGVIAIIQLIKEIKKQKNGGLTNQRNEK